MSRVPETPLYGHYALTPGETRLLRLAQSRPPTWLGRRLALLARRLALRGRREPIDADAEGFHLRVHVGDNVSERKYLFMPQFCDPMERDYLARHLTPGGVFLDIGANAGIYTLTAARAYARLGGGRVVAVEANPTMQARLRYNVALNDLDDQVDLAPLALSGRDGEVEFSISDDNLGESGLLATGGRSIRVPCRTLAGLLAERGITHMDGMKIDVEGMEDAILMPFLANADPGLLPRFIIIEDSTHRWHDDLLGALTARGYTLRAQRKMNLVLALNSADAAPGAS
jgi:FkbM family methyltransferase